MRPPQVWGQVGQPAAKPGVVGVISLGLKEAQTESVSIRNTCFGHVVRMPSGECVDAEGIDDDRLLGQTYGLIVNV